MIHVHVAVERNTNSVAEDAKENQVKITGSASEDEAFPVSDSMDRLLKSDIVGERCIPYKRKGFIGNLLIRNLSIK